MALITCPKCGKQFSDRINVCPQCGATKEEIDGILAEQERARNERAAKAAEKARQQVAQEEKDAQQRAEQRKAGWRKNAKWIIPTIVVALIALCGIIGVKLYHSEQEKRCVSNINIALWPLGLSGLLGEIDGPTGVIYKRLVYFDEIAEIEDTYVPNLTIKANFDISSLKRYSGAKNRCINYCAISLPKGKQGVISIMNSNGDELITIETALNNVYNITSCKTYAKLYYNYQKVSGNPLICEFKGETIYNGNNIEIIDGTLRCYDILPNGDRYCWSEMEKESVQGSKGVSTTKKYYPSGNLLFYERYNEVTNRTEERKLYNEDGSPMTHK